MPFTRTQHVGHQQADENRDRGVEQEQADQPRAGPARQLGVHQRANNGEQDQRGSDRCQQPQDKFRGCGERGRGLAEHDPGQQAECERAEDAQVQRRGRPPPPDAATRARARMGSQRLVIHGPQLVVVRRWCAPRGCAYPAIFSPATPSRMSPMHASRRADADSPSSMIPSSAVPAAPRPVHTA